MRIDEIFASAVDPLFSFEFFPPKTDEGERNLRHAIETLSPLEPAFVSVTYGAGGSTRARTVELTKWIKQDLGIESMAHLTCVGASRDELRTVLDGIAAAGIDNVLALRGDPPRGQTEWTPHPEGLRYSTELATMI
ncbi:MAG: methylenetetrahydrofolate reductase, partial [Solirubrobacteraceae bacterium]